MTNVDDFLKYACGYMKHDINADFRIRVRSAVLQAVREVNQKSEVTTYQSK